MKIKRDERIKRINEPRKSRFVIRSISQQPRPWWWPDAILIETTNYNYWIFRTEHIYHEWPNSSS